MSGAAVPWSRMPRRGMISRSAPAIRASSPDHTPAASTTARAGYSMPPATTPVTAPPEVTKLSTRAPLVTEARCARASCSQAAARAPGWTWASSGQKLAARMTGERAGSSARAWSPVSHSRGTPPARTRSKWTRRRASSSSEAARMRLPPRR
jgi:hypothetical protein